MPIGSDPSDTVPVVLKIDQAKPDPKPTFRVRFLTDREARKADALVRAAHHDRAEQEYDAADAKLDELFAMALIGWENVTHRGEARQHGADKPADFLSPGELLELAGQCVTAPLITERDRRNFESPSGHSGAASATAPAASASMPQPPLPPSA